MDSLPARSAEDCITNQKNRQGRSRSGNLGEQVVHPEMWPTPTTQEIEHPNAELTDTGRRKSKDGKSSHSLNLADQVNMWPTPRVSDTEGGVVKNVEKKNDSYSRVNKKGVRFGVKLKDAVGYEEEKLWPTPRASAAMSESIDNVKRRGRDKGNLEEKIAQETWPTPSTRDYKGGHGTIVEEDGKYYRVSNTTGTKYGARLDAQVEKMEKGALNPDWVEWLMGYATGYTDPEYTEPMQLEDHLGFESEPDIPRVTTRKEHRVNRLKCLGNSIVPQIMFHIGNAILADYNKENK